MSTEVGGRSGRVLSAVPGSTVDGGKNQDPGALARAAMASAFAGIGAPDGSDAPPSGELTLADMWKLMDLCLPRGGRVTDAADGMVTPDAIAADARLRMAYRIGAQAARELGLDTGGFSAEELMALGRQTLADHAMSGTPESVLVAVARAEGKVDEAAWAAGDQDKVSTQVGAFLESEFKDEIALYQSLDELAAEPPVMGRGELAAALLREHGIDPDAVIDNGNENYAYDNVSASSPPLVRDQKAVDYYFNRDKLTAADVRKMKLRGGGVPTDAHIDQLLRALPASLDAEFTRRFDGHQQRMSTLLATWLSARLSLHARSAGIGLAGASVTISRAKMRLFPPSAGMRIGGEGRPAAVYGTRPSVGFLVAIRAGDRTHQCFVSTRTGAVHAIPEGQSAVSWLHREHELAFDDAAPMAALAERPGRWFPRATVEEKSSGSHAAIGEWLPAMFRAEIEQGREAARGETLGEAAVDALLNLIPFRAMVVALRKGDIPMAVMMGGLDMFSLIPFIGAGVRLSSAAARSASPWLSMSVRFGSAAGRQGLDGARRLAARIPALGDRIRSGLAESAIQGWGRLRPLDVQRVAQALRPTAPRLADMLEGMVARSRGPAVADGVWRIHAGGRAAAAAGDAVTAIPVVTARNTQGGTLKLLPYGERAGAYTQVDVAGGRTGALLLVDSGGWLHQTLPVATLERYRVGSPATLRSLGPRRIDPDGTVVLDGNRYARLGGDYVRVAPDPAVSTALRPIWRIVAPPGVRPDVVTHRLVYDAQEGLWRQAGTPALAGGGNIQTLGVGMRNRWRATVSPGADVRMTPCSAQVTEFMNLMVRGIGDAKPSQLIRVEELLSEVATNRRGEAILRAMAAHYALLGQMPEIILGGSPGPTRARPSLDQPMRGLAWNLDLRALEHSTTETLVNELAAVYNNMTGLLQNDDPFHALLAAGQPELDPRLERAWAAWQSQGQDAAAPAGQEGAAAIKRESAVNQLRTQLREVLCYGGLDKSTFKSMLRNQGSNWSLKIDLCRRELDSVPPLPADTKILVISHNPVRDWSNLPSGLVTLEAQETGMTQLPADLPSGLLGLDVSGNLLRSARLDLPPRLMRLDIGHNGLTTVPRLPQSLRMLIIGGNDLHALPEILPKGLRVLDVSNNALTKLPAALPPELKVLLVRGNRLAHLPEPLPATLEDIDASENRLIDLPALPDMLRILEVADNRLVSLPDNLPRAMEILTASRNGLRRLPDDLPTSLLVLSVRHNAIVELPANITALETTRIHLEGNPLPVERIPVIAPDRAGPTIFFSMLTTSDERPQYVRTLMQALQHWLANSSPPVHARWDALARAFGQQENAIQFSLFLDTLRSTVSYRDAGFRAQVEDWLVELSKPERRALLDDTLAVCVGASDTCEDRITSAWNDMQTLRLNDDVRQGRYDTRPADVANVARQMFRLDVLARIARRKVRTLRVSDELEVYLSYVVMLRDSLDLTAVAPGMRYYSQAEVSADDLREAAQEVRARERADFDKYLVLDYEPWQTLLKRRDAQAYADAEQAAHRLLEAFEQRLQQEIDKLGIDAQDSALLADARKDLGPLIMRHIRYEAMAPLTDSLLRPQGEQ